MPERDARHVVVTGGSRGIGLAIVRRLARDGFDVTALARTRSEGLSEAMAAADTADRIRFRTFDLADIEGLAGLVRAMRADGGPIYGLINNAGIGTAGVLANLRDAQIEQLVRLNTVSPMVLTRHVVRSMLARSGGRIINIASIVASSGYAGLSVYSATKASLVGFTRSLAREVGPTGITVNAVSPGFVDTEMTHGLEPSDRARIVRRSALRRMPGVEDVAAAVAFLASDEAANMTGQVLTVDAGNTI